MEIATSFSSEGAELAVDHIVNEELVQIRTDKEHFPPIGVTSTKWLMIGGCG